ncbi:hypothetical protein EJ08DRAFT_372814 [Tothia fuscella]|uniref:Uncharacterized protein n=1 Tax=Tothia fuscella TaxID=1048955 RepID=A0A9P4NLZ9_9PEZI|nr:hypothetical protein EJ08DRAFT_372814 [Tothia fuscella]
MLLPQYHDENRRLLQEWRQQISDDPAANRILFGQEQPTEETLEELWERTVEKDKQASHLWRDGVSVGLPMRQLSNGEFRLPMLTARGCLAMTFPYFTEKPRAKICYLLGGRGLFVLVPYDSDDSMFRTSDLDVEIALLTDSRTGRALRSARLWG